MNVAAALHTNRMCASLTGLQVREFEDLVSQFEWNYKEYRIRLKPARQRAFGGGVKGKISTIEEKLLFVLMYLKTYPTIDVLSFTVGFDRSRASRWVQTLFPVLEMTLKRKLVLPERKISSVEEFYRKFPGVKEVFADGAERRIQRPKNKKRQNKTYSGKKKAHTRKNIVLADKNKRIILLTKTKSGRRHDKRLADKEDVFTNIPEDVAVWLDTGFTGVKRQHFNTFIPAKRRKNHPLTEDEKETNHIISSIRVVVEHALAGMKRYQCLQSPYRNRIPKLDDKFALLSAGLWNYHLSFST